MTIAYSDNLATYVLDSGYTKWASADLLQLRSGAAPGPNAAPTGTLLATVVLPASPMNAAAARAKTKNGTWSVAAVATGTIGHYRLVKAGDPGTADATQPREEGSVTITGGGGDMTVDNTSIAINQVVTVNTFTKTL